MKVLLSALIGFSTLLCQAAEGPSPRERAEQLVAKMSFDQKMSMVSGIQGSYVGNTPAIPSLNIPALTLEDGPQGVADGVRQVTCWPSALTNVASWDRDLMFSWGVALGQEQRAKGTSFLPVDSQPQGTNIMLGPDVNIARVPVDGRNYEAMGEDPYLAGAMSSAEVEGVQTTGVMATVKHWVNNNQEYNRTTTSANVGQRAQYEIYYPAFKACVDAGVGAVMCSYNRINDTWACENQVALTTDLKETLGFQGFVMSDWGATHSTVESANAGLDMEMPDNQYFGPALATAIQQGLVNLSRLDDMVTRIFTSAYAVGIMDEPVQGNITANVQTAAHTELARLLATAAVTLATNNGILPLGSPATIGLLGEGAVRPYITGTGSGEVVAPYIVSPLEAITARATGSQVSYVNNASIPDAVTLAASVDVAIVFVGVTSGEGYDRANLSLPGNQDEFVSAIAAANPNTVVVVNSPGAVLMPWINDVSAVVLAWLPGQEAGNGLAPVLFGDVDPSGRCPLTFPATEDQVPASTVEQYPGIDNNAAYSEGLLVGYRWYDAMGETPLFCFGHGLSYTNYTYSGLKIDGTGYHLSFRVTNTGQSAGYEVPQLYLGFPASAGEPPQVLRSFQKIYLAPGQTQTVLFDLDASDFTIWDVPSHAWAKVTGTFNYYIGSSSCNIRLKGSATHH